MEVIEDNIKGAQIMQQFHTTSCTVTLDSNTTILKTNLFFFQATAVFEHVVMQKRVLGFYKNTIGDNFMWVMPIDFMVKNTTFEFVNNQVKNLD